MNSPCTETGVCPCLNGSGVSEVSCPVIENGSGDGTIITDHCDSCDAGYELRDKECLIPPSCDDHVCSDDSICVIENDEPTCSQFHCVYGVGEIVGEWMAVGVTAEGNVACKTETLSSSDSLGTVYKY